VGRQRGDRGETEGRQRGDRGETEGCYEERRNWAGDTSLDSKTAPVLSKHGTVEVAGGHRRWPEGHRTLGYQDSNLD
jgi:hypothetical protein